MQQYIYIYKYREREIIYIYKCRCRGPGPTMAAAARVSNPAFLVSARFFWVNSSNSNPHLQYEEPAMHTKKRQFMPIKVQVLFSVLKQ